MTAIPESLHSRFPHKMKEATYTTICFLAKRGLRRNLRVRRVTGASAIIAEFSRREPPAVRKVCFDEGGGGWLAAGVCRLSLSSKNHDVSMYFLILLGVGSRLGPTCPYRASPNAVVPIPPLEPHGGFFFWLGKFQGLFLDNTTNIFLNQQHYGVCRTR